MLTPHTQNIYVHTCLPLFMCMSAAHIHIVSLQEALSLDFHVPPPPDSTNKDKLQQCPSSPKTHPIISFSHPCLSPLPPSIVPSHLALCGRWASQDPTVIGLDIIYCPLGNVAFQHLIKIISSHSNGRYGLKGTHCNHLDTRRGSCSLSLSLTLFFLLCLCSPVSLQKD